MTKKENMYIVAYFYMNHLLCGPAQYHPVELSTVTEMFCICVVQGGKPDTCDSWPDGEFPWQNAPNRSKAGPVAILKEEARNRRVISPKHLWGELTHSVGCSVLVMGSETRDVLPGHVPGERVRWWSSHEDVRNLGGGWAGFHMFSNMVDLSVFPATT